MRTTAAVVVVITVAVACSVLHRVDSMALLRTGSPLDWSQSKPYLNAVRLSGVKQFIHHYKRVRDVQSPLLLWGDELEYGVFAYNNSSKVFDLSLRGAEIREDLSSLEEQYNQDDTTSGCAWQPEYGAWMVEAVPCVPYGISARDLLQVEDSMRLRRRRLRDALRQNEIAPSLSLFPMMGAEGYAHTHPRGGRVSSSESVSDDIINPHPRFGALTRNIRMRRGRNVDIQVPLEVAAADVSDSNNSNNSSGRPEDATRMDAMAFGMGCCCLQVTLQCRDEEQSRRVHDLMVILAPLFLALSAATPAIGGRLRDTDTRWDIISQSVDDRTPCESGEGQSSAAAAGGLPDESLAGKGVQCLPKSRYSSVSRYIAKAENEEKMRLLERLNDVDAGFDGEVLSMMLDSGIDRTLSQHIAYLFTRDPLVIFDDAINVDDTRTMEHFDNIQSTNWQSVRWKTPVIETGLEIESATLATTAADSRTREEQIQAIVDSRPGWRVEFRPLEIQLSDFDNAAFAVGIVLAIRALLATDQDLYIPMSLNEENFRRAQRRDAVLGELFYVRAPDGVSAEQITLDRFFNGPASPPAGRFSGLLPLIYSHLRDQGWDEAAIGSVRPYLALLGDKASGRTPTTARVIRDFIKQHGDYNGDGRISASTCNDLLVFADNAGWKGGSGM